MLAAINWPQGSSSFCEIKFEPRHANELTLASLAVEKSLDRFGLRHGI